MDILFLISVAILLTFFVFALARIVKLYYDERGAKNRVGAVLGAIDEARNEERQQNRRLMVGGRRHEAGGLRARLGAALRARGQEGDGAAAAAVAEEEGDFDDGDGEDVELAGDPGMGKKKLAKMQLKAERRAQHEMELREREERKTREAEKEARAAVEREREKQLEAEQAAAEQREREEKERQEHEVYLQMKEAFSVEEEGFDEKTEAESENLLREFVDYVKRMKVVNMDELASHFKLRESDAVDRIRSLVADGSLTGVVDDRGKFIYISLDELAAVAKFINQRGRVSVSELAEYSNQLIRLEPDLESDSNAGAAEASV